MLGLAKRCRARMLISSTSEVYGDPLQHPQTESYWGNVNPIGERSCYDEGAWKEDTVRGAARGSICGIWGLKPVGSDCVAHFRLLVDPGLWQAF